ncbi:MAG: L,D-transpeptidase [Actinobacteria bacterium]|nr:L,D-transpeptidase [Actinomycetota bacterium]
MSPARGGGILRRAWGSRSCRLIALGAAAAIFLPVAPTQAALPGVPMQVVAGLHAQTRTQIVPRAIGVWDLDPYRLTPALAHVARVVVPTRALTLPGRGPMAMRVSPLAEWGGGRVQYLVLRSAIVDGRRWLRVRLPERPNDDAGWIRADLTRVSTTPWRILVSTSSSEVTVLRGGLPMVSFPAVVGKPSTPTPHGLFAIDEPIRQPTGSELGPWALFLTAHSRVLDDYGGGPGRIAIHGRAGPLLADPLGTPASHGCIRIANARVRWLARVAVNGTPVEVGE